MFNCVVHRGGAGGGGEGGRGGQSSIREFCLTHSSGLNSLDPQCCLSVTRLWWVVPRYFWSLGGGSCLSALWSKRRFAESSGDRDGRAAHPLPQLRSARSSMPALLGLSSLPLWTRDLVRSHDWLARHHNSVASSVSSTRGQRWLLCHDLPGLLGSGLLAHISTRWSPWLRSSALGYELTVYSVARNPV